MTFATLCISGAAGSSGEDNTCVGASAAGSSLTQHPAYRRIPSVFWHLAPLVATPFLLFKFGRAAFLPDEAQCR